MCAPGRIRLGQAELARGELPGCAARDILVHLLHDDQGRAFRAKLGEVMPDYEVRREALRLAGMGPYCGRGKTFNLFSRSNEDRFLGNPKRSDFVFSW